MVLTSTLVLNVPLFNNNNLPLHLQLEDIQCETVSYPRQKKKKLLIQKYYISAIQKANALYILCFLDTSSGIMVGKLT